MKKRTIGLVLASFLFAATANAETYVVVSGDSLSKIASNYGVTVNQLKETNGLVSDNLSIDQELVIPGNDNSDQLKKVAVVNADRLNFREAGDLGAKIIKVLDWGTEVELVTYGEEWSKVQVGEDTGYVATTYLNFDQQSTSSRASDLSVSRLKALANSLIGSPYRYGGTTPRGFDCSGFTGYVMRQMGVELPRSSAEQFTVGTRVSRDDLQPGDLVFFDTSGSGRISHVGIYIGNNKMVHSATRRVESDDLDWYFNHYKYFGAKRVLGN